MHGVTGRMGMNQHLIRSICAIRAQGGVTLSNGDKVMPDPILIGRNAEKMEALAKAHNIPRWGTDLDKALENKDDTIFFDAGTTQMRPALLAKAIRAGKHVYCEKPIATNLNEAVEIARLAEEATKTKGLKHGAVQDKLFLPGLRKLDMLRRAGFFGRMLSVRLEFGYWVFEGDLQPIQRPSWNYRKEDGGGMILDMMCHWRYVLDNLFGEVKSISCLGATHIPQRWDEEGRPYKATADDAAYATAQLVGHGGEPVIAQDAHIRLVSPENNGGLTILRRGFSYTDGIDDIGLLDAGLFFIAFQQDPRKQFVPLQRKIGRVDALNEYIKHTGSGLWACPPGLVDDSRTWADQLFG